MFAPPPLSTDTILDPVVEGWRRCLEAARKDKKVFDRIGRQCMDFYKGSNGFMWKKDWQREHLGGEVDTKIRIDLNKAHEYVAIFGPTLFWDYPVRHCEPVQRLDFSPEVFGNPQDPMTQQIHQFAMQEEQRRYGIQSTKCQLMERYLNYTPREQNPTLIKHTDKALIDAMVKGRGCLWSKPYRMPGSDLVLTGQFYHSVDSLLTDPDQTSIHEARWIARSDWRNVYEVEREFSLPRGSLKEFATRESEDRHAKLGDDHNTAADRQYGETCDMIQIHRIWSKCGVGTRLKDVQSRVNDAFEDVVGDYAYIVIADGVPYPLNAPPRKLKRASDDDVKAMFRWPVEYWRDNRWPVEVLDFFENTEHSWPIAPLAPGLGTLLFINFMVSMLGTRVMRNTQEIWLVAKAAEEAAKQAIAGTGDVAIPLNVNVGSTEDVSRMLQQLTRSEVTPQAFQIIQMAMNIFDKQTGLNELLYGQSSTQIRSATDAEAKHQQVSIRPERMAKQVEAWQSQCARAEMACAATFVRGQSIAPLMGNIGAMLWDQHIASQSQEQIYREMNVTIEAGSTRRPNKAREAQNMGQIFHSLAATLDNHASITGDTTAFNELVQRFGKSIDVDMSGLALGPRMPPQPPPPPPEVQQQQQAMMQLDLAERQAEVEKQAAETQKTRVETAKIQAELQQIPFEQAMKQSEFQMNMQQDQAEFAMDAQQDQAKFEQDVRQKQIEHALKLRQSEQTHEQKLEQIRAQQRMQARRQTQGSAA